MQRKIGIFTICLGMALVLLGAFFKVNGTISKQGADAVITSGMFAEVLAFMLLLTSKNNRKSGA